MLNPQGYFTVIRNSRGSHAKSYNCQQYLSGPKVLNSAGRNLEVEFDNFRSTQDK